MDLTLQYIIDSQKSLLAELNRLQAYVRDYARGVVQRYATGVYLFGRPGTAKTHTVRAVLEEAREPFTYQRGHLTPVGLFDLIAEHPNEVIVLDDLVSIFRSDVALQILLSALEHPSAPDRGRTVRYKRHDEERRVYFRGGIICISNRELHDEELLGAFKSRVHTLNYDPSDAQLGALMLDISTRAWPADRPSLSPSECGEVARFVLGEMMRLECRFDLRLFVNKGLPLYQQWKDDETESHWRDLVTASIEQHLVTARHPEVQPSRNERKEGEQALVQEILREHSTRMARVRAWAERTGKSERAFYRRLAEMH